MDITKLKLPELKKLAKEQGLKGFSNKKKNELLSMLEGTIGLTPIKIKVKKQTPKTAAPKTAVSQKTAAPKIAIPKTAVSQKTAAPSQLDVVVDEFQYKNFDFGNFNDQLQNFSNKARDEIRKKTKKEGSVFEVNFLTRFLPKLFLKKVLDKYGLKMLIKKLYEFTVEEMENDGIDRDAVLTEYKLTNVPTKYSAEFSRIMDKEGASAFIK